MQGSHTGARCRGLRIKWRGFGAVYHNTAKRTENWHIVKPTTMETNSAVSCFCFLLYRQDPVMSDWNLLSLICHQVSVSVSCCIVNCFGSNCASSSVCAAFNIRNRSAMDPNPTEIGWKGMQEVVISGGREERKCRYETIPFLRDANVTLRKRMLTAYLKQIPTVLESLLLFRVDARDSQRWLWATFRSVVGYSRNKNFCSAGRSVGSLPICDAVVVRLRFERSLCKTFGVRAVKKFVWWISHAAHYLDTAQVQKLECGGIGNESTSCSRFQNSGISSKKL